MSNTPARIDDSQGPVWTPPPPEPTYDFGWLILVLGSVALLLCSWLLFDTDGPGMWAGYISELVGIVALAAACMARTTLPIGPSVTMGLVSGLGLLVFALTHLNLDNSRATIPEIICGAMITLGSAMMASRSRS